MAVAKTTEWFLNRAKEVHGDTYDYSLSLYKMSRDKLKINCRRHGLFEQTANSHLAGHGCKKCKYLATSLRRTITLTKFLLRANIAHSDRYDYKFVNIICAKTPVEIICKEHGNFLQKPHHHMSGHGCPKCSAQEGGDVCPKCSAQEGGDVCRKTKLQYIEDAVEVHGDYYDYSLVDYKGSNHKVNIICPTHGIFEQQAQSHISGRGCPGCNLKGGFNKFLVSELYILQCGDMVKVGITNKDAGYRAKHVGNSFGSEFKVIKRYSDLCGKIALKAETDVLKLLRSLYMSPVTSFEGSTECFFNVPIDWLDNIIIKEIRINENERDLWS